MWHEKIEAWALEQADIKFDARAQSSLRAMKWEHEITT
jgi:hypothetical protein